MTYTFNFGPRAERFAMRPPKDDWPINILEGAVRSGKTWSTSSKNALLLRLRRGWTQDHYRGVEAERL